MPVKSPYPSLQLPSTDVLSYVFGAGTPSDTPIWIDATDTSKFLSARTLLQWAKRLTIGLDRLGVQRGEVVLIYTPNHIFVPVAYLGVVGAGRVFSGANPAYGVEELAHQIRTLSARIILVHPAMIKTAQAASKSVGLSDECLYTFSDGENEPLGGLKDWRSFIGSPQEAEDYQWSRLGPDSQDWLAAVNFSSGTTGLPKGVMITHQNMIANVEQTIFMKNAHRDPSQRPPERWIGFLPLYHAFGQLYICLMAAKLGIPTFIMKSFVFENFLNLIQTQKITHLQVAPPILVMLSKRPETAKYDLSSVANVGCGAAPLSQGLQNDCTSRLNLPISQGWGMTELTCSGIGVPGGVESNNGSVGVLYPSCEGRLLDEQGKEVGPNERGELYFRGPNVSPGYWKNVDATRQTMTTGGWLRTGDVAIYDEEGWFWIVDRLKELIKVNGLQVAPAELEALLLRHDDIADVGVVGVSSEHEEWPRAYVALKEQSKGNIKPEEVQEWMKTRAAKHKWLQGGVVFVEEIPKLASGKIQRRILRDWAREEAKRLASPHKARL